MKKLLFLFVIIAVIAGVYGFYKYSPTSTDTSIAEEKPDPSDNDQASTSDLIHVSAPKSQDKISSPLVVKGEARGNWFFEASFPIYLTDWDGRIIAQGHAEAKGDWMTSEFVPFEATIVFTRPDYVKAGTYSERGTLILHNDNPSGDPKNDKAVEIPILFR